MATTRVSLSPVEGGPNDVPSIHSQTGIFKNRKFSGSGTDTDIITFDYSEKNKEIDVDDFEDKICIKLEYTSDDYQLVKNALLKIAATPEQAVWKLLKID